MQGANLGFWDSDRRTGQTYRDAFWFDLLGIPESEQGYRHEDWYERVAADQREQVMQTFGSHLLGVGDFVELDYRIRRWDGRYMWVQDRARVLEVDKHGQPARIVGVMQEVTRPFYKVSTTTICISVLRTRGSGFRATPKKKFLRLSHNWKGSWIIIKMAVDLDWQFAHRSSAPKLLGFEYVLTDLATFVSKLEDGAK